MVSTIDIRWKSYHTVKPEIIHAHPNKDNFSLFHLLTNDTRSFFSIKCLFLCCFQPFVIRILAYFLNKICPQKERCKMLRMISVWIILGFIVNLIKRKDLITRLELFRVKLMHIYAIEIKTNQVR